MKFFGGEASDYAGYLMLCIKNGVFAFLNSELISRVYILSDIQQKKQCSYQYSNFQLHCYIVVSTIVSFFFYQNK